MHRHGAWLLAACCALGAPELARAEGPQLTYTPSPDSSAPDPTVSSCLAAPQGTTELDFGAGCTPGVPCPVAIVADNTPGETSMFCSAQTVSGNGAVGLQQSPSPFLFGPAGATQTLFATCARGSQTTRARLCCVEARANGDGLAKSYPVFDIACPAIGTPVFASDPAAGTTLVLVGASGTPVQRPIAVRNDGDATLTVTAQAPAPPFAVTPPGQLSVVPGPMAASFAVSCVPGSETSRTDLRLDTNDPARQGAANAIVFPLECVPEADAAPPRPRFSATTPDVIQARVSVSGSVQLVVSNTGDAPLNLASAAVGSPFQVTPAGASVAPGAAATFVVSCGNAPAGPYNSAVSFDTDDPDRDPALVVVNCLISPDTAPVFASVPPAPGPLVIATPQFTTGTAPLVVRNDGTALLTVTSAAFLPGSAPNLSVSPGSSGAIIPGDTRTFTLSCGAGAAGSFPGTLRLLTNAGTVDFGVNCGVNAAPAPRLVSVPVPGGSIGFDTNQSTPLVKTLVLQNAGNATLSITSIGGPAGPQLTRSMPALPLAIAPGTGATLTLTCSSAASGTFNDQVTVASNDAATPIASYPLLCNVAGPPPAPQFASSPAAPGPLVINTDQRVPASTTLAVTNTGNASLAITGVANVAPPFTVTPTTATIAPGASASLVVGCDAVNDGNFARTVVLQTNVSGTPTVNLDLVCNVDFQPASVTFSPPLTYSAGLLPRGLAVGDLDLDGFRDVAVVNRSFSGALTLLFGTGTGGFRLPFGINTGGGVDSFSVVLGQLNGDGRPDLLVASNGSNALQVILSTGPGTYGGPQNVSTTGARDVALGRLDQNMFDDIATVGFAGIVYRFGMGGGSFSGQSTISTPGQGDAVEIADTNADGLNDIVVAFSGLGLVGVARGAGGMSFQPLQTYAAGSGPRDLRVADFNRDGRADIVVANGGSNRITLLPGTATGFGSPQPSVVDNFPYALEVADFNRDGRVDIAATGGSTVSVLLGKGDGRFAPAFSFGVPGGAEGIGVGDFDGDGLSDIVATSSGIGMMSLLINGPGRFLAPTTQLTTNVGTAIVAGHFDGDGRTDVVTSNLDSVNLLRGNGDGTLQAAVRFGAGTSPKDVAAADFNGDGKLDVVTAENGNSPLLYLGDGLGSLQPPVPAPNIGATTRVVVGDLTGDARPDLVLAGSTLQGLRWNSTLMGFEPLTVPAVSNPVALALGDLDRDGDLDIVAAAGTTLQRLLNQGGGSFALPLTTSTGFTPVSIAIADLNRDGNPDVAIASDGVRVFLGDGAGGFTGLPLTNPTAGRAPGFIVPADINGDGRPDIVLSIVEKFFESLGLMVGAGNGTFAQPATYFAGFSPFGVAVGAFNDDMAPDVAVTASGGVVIRLNATANYGVVFANGFE